MAWCNLFQPKAKAIWPFYVKTCDLLFSGKSELFAMQTAIDMISELTPLLAGQPKPTCLPMLHPTLKGDC